MVNLKETLEIEGEWKPTAAPSGRSVTAQEAARMWTGGVERRVSLPYTRGAWTGRCAWVAQGPQKLGRKSEFCSSVVESC